MKLRKTIALPGRAWLPDLTACGGNNANANTSAARARLRLFRDASQRAVTVKLGIVGGINEDCGPAKATGEEGIDLELVNFSDYVTPTGP